MTLVLTVLSSDCVGERHPELGHARAVLAGARLASDGEHLPNGLPVASAWPAGERVAIYVKYKAVRVFIKTKTHQCHSMATLGYLALFWGCHLPNREL